MQVNVGFAALIDNNQPLFANLKTFTKHRINQSKSGKKKTTRNSKKPNALRSNNN